MHATFLTYLEESAAGTHAQAGRAGGGVAGTEFNANLILSLSSLSSTFFSTRLYFGHMVTFFRLPASSASLFQSLITSL